MTPAEERRARDDLYQEALTALAKARVAHWSWDAWGESEALGEALGLVEALLHAADESKEEERPR